MISLKTKKIIKLLTEISTLSLLFFLVFFIVNDNLKSDEEYIELNSALENNNSNYKKVNIVPIANVWVAITSNIWLWLNKWSTIKQENINNKIFSTKEFYETPTLIHKTMIKKNMIFTKEYLNIIRMDFNSIIKKSDNREKTLNNIITQLQIRYKNANTNLVTLAEQRNILNTEYEKVNTKISSLKNNLENNFNQTLTDKVLENTQNYYELKNKETIIKTNIIFINEFIKKYNYLNNYNKIILDTLINNKDIISKDSYIVIPDSWDKLLKEFDLIFSEQEYKENNKK